MGVPDQRGTGGDGPFLAQVLTHPHATPVLALLDTSVRYQRPPSAWVGGDGEWTEKDHLLTHAHTLYQRSLCPDCGHTREACAAGAWAVTTRTCGPSAAVERWRKENPNPDPGTVVSVQPAATAQAATLESAPDWWREKYGIT